MAREIDSSWNDYESSTLWIHESCRNWRTNNFSYLDFEILYNYLRSGGLEFKAIQWVPNVTHDERQDVEALAAIGWNTVLPEGENFTGFIGLEPDPEDPNELVMGPRSEQPFYFPLHFGEPRKSNSKAAGYDLFSPPWERPAILKALETYRPALTGGFQLSTHGPADGYSVVLYHPGAQLDEKFKIKPKDLSNMVINTRDLLMRAARYPSESLAVYLYDVTASKIDEEISPEFLAGLEVRVGQDRNGTNAKDLVSVAERNLDDVIKNGSFSYEREMEIGGRVWKALLAPVDDTFEPQFTFVVLSAVLMFVASLFLAIWMIHNTRRSIQMHRVISKAAAEASIVANLFPTKVRERMIRDVEARNFKTGPSRSKDLFLNNGRSSQELCENRLNQLLTSEGIFGSKPIADLHPYTTIMFSDLVGFSAWSSAREPSQVFTLLETLFHSWDNIAARRRVYKVETEGDNYVAASGLPEPRKDHAVVMARFATDCLHRMQKLLKALEIILGPDTSELGCRIGLHSGQCVGGVLRGDKGRFQLFGSAVSHCAAMASSGVRNKIPISPETAELLIEAGHEKWVIPREDTITLKGKGEFSTFFLKIVAGSRASFMARNYQDVGLTGLSVGNIQRREQAPPQSASMKGDMVLDEVAEIIALPDFKGDILGNQVDPESVDLDPEVVRQLSDLITKIAHMYRDNPFHNFEHASHVTLSVIKMLGRIVDPKAIAKKQNAENDDENELHNRIASDPLTQFACAFSSLIHDLDHQGVTNTTLIQEASPLAQKCKNKSVAEQNSVDLAWELLAKPDYDKLRVCLCKDSEEFSRFRSLVVNSVMATDTMDKELGAARKARWNKAFNESAIEEPAQVAIYRKATIIIEHLIQASDISHTMQHWAIYVKWNERLFLEMYKAYKAGRIDKDPSLSWYEGEKGFFDFYIIPLAKKLFTCGVFGVSSDEFLNYAISNRREWEQKGADMVKQYMANFENDTSQVA